MYIKDKLARVDSLDEALELTVVRVRRVWYLEVEGQVLVVLVIPAGQDYKNCRLFPIALVDTKNTKNVNYKCAWVKKAEIPIGKEFYWRFQTYSWPFKSRMDRMWMRDSLGSVVKSSGFKSISLILW